MSTISKMLNFSSAIEALQEDILATEYPPELKKSSPLFAVGDVCKFVNIKQTNLQKLIREKEVDCHINAQGKRVFDTQQMQALREHLQKSAFKTSYMKSRPGSAKKPFVLAVVNLKGGSSKTSTALNLAQWLALQSYRVLAIDSDPQGSLTSMLGLLPFERETDLASDFVNLDDTLLSLYTQDNPLEPIKTYFQNLDLVPANIRLFDAEFELPARQKEEEGFSFFNLLNSEIENGMIADDYDIVVIDCPPSFSYLTLNALYAADGLIVPVPPKHMDILATGAFFDHVATTFSDIAQITGSEKEFDFILGLRTQVSGGIRSARNVNRINMALGTSMIIESVPESKVFYEASSLNKSIYELSATDVDRRTLNKVRESLEAIHVEIEENIVNAWNKQMKLGL